MIGVSSTGSAQETDEIQELCERLAGMGYYVARQREIGENMEERVTDLSVQILNDGARGEVHKAIAAKMVASLNLGLHGVGTPDEIASFIYNNCMNTEWVPEE